MSTAETRDKFEKKYSIPFPLSLDKDQKMTARFGASATPQVFVVRTRDNTVLYKGRIDNSFESIGRRRQVVTQHYLQKALENILQNKPADPTTTEPVGCFISKR
jgi:peroxiredoxin